MDLGRTSSVLKLLIIIKQIIKSICSNIQALPNSQSFPHGIPAEFSYNLTRPLIAHLIGQIPSSFLLNLVKTAQSSTRNYTTFQEELSPHHTTCDITQTTHEGGSSLAPIDVTLGLVRSFVRFFYIFTVKILCIFRTRRGSDSSQHQSQHNTLLGWVFVFNCFCA